MSIAPSSVPGIAAASTGGDAGVIGAAGGPTAPEVITTGTQTVWVSVVSATATTSDDVNSVDAASARALVAQMNSYWSAETGGVITIAFGGVETRSLGLGGCSAASALQAGAAKAFSGRFANEKWRGTADHLLLLTTESCGGAGLGTVGGDGGVMLSGNGTSTGLAVPVAVHEFGHNLGFGHAASTVCRTDEVDGAVANFGGPASSCPTDEYGDYLDIMGYSLPGSLPHLSSVQRIRAGYLSDFMTVRTSPSSTTVTVTPLDGGAGNRALRVIDPISGERYYVEYRTPTGTDATSTEFTGTQLCSGAGGYAACSRGVSSGEVRVLRELPYPGYSTYVRTTVVAAGAIVGDPASRTTGLTAGATFASANGGFYLRVNSEDAAGASVTVRFTPPTSTSSSLSASPTEAYGIPVAATVTVATADGSPATGLVSVLDGDAVVGTRAISGGTTTVALQPLSVGAHALTVNFSPSSGDLLASTSPATKLTITKASTKATIAAKKKLKRGGKARVTVRVTGATDPTGLVKVYANGKKVGQARLAASARGIIVVTTSKLKKAGAVTLTASYAGSPTAARSTTEPRALRIR